MPLKEIEKMKQEAIEGLLSQGFTMEMIEEHIKNLRALIDPIFDEFNEKLQMELDTKGHDIL